ncbi:hypothetical protein TIFTF001_013658 [Ficus carica]|uniref:Uncharacterized protein n=1 Tax=Ficus carica TaxID=3494 RepID=A0AA88D353_FICCA|nr:hypothetical protein TIFTF001_013658 [Ficus carica]
MRLAEHQGKKYKVIEEALAFVGDVEEANRFVTPEKLYSSPFGPSDENLATCEGKRPNILCNILVSSFNFARKSLKLDFLGGVLGNAALVTISMVALLHMHQVTRTEHQQRHEDDFFSNRRVRKTSRLQESSSDDHLDVLLARVIPSVFPIGTGVEYVNSYLQLYIDDEQIREIDEFSSSPLIHAESRLGWLAASSI